MYKFLLTSRYLRRKLIPWFALLAVMLCTAMVIIVGSIMGGFLDLVRDAGKSVMGDVVVYCGVSGFPHYEDLIDELERQPQARAATPVISSYGLIKFPDAQRTDYVEVIGIDAKRYGQVTDYASTLVWNSHKLQAIPRQAEQIKQQIDAIYQRLDRLQPPTETSTAPAALSASARAKIRQYNRRLYDLYAKANGLLKIAAAYGHRDPATAAIELDRPFPADQDARPGMVLGLEVNPDNQRTRSGQYIFHRPLIHKNLLLTVLPLSRGGAVVDPKVQPFTVANEFHSGFYAVDSRRVYVPFDTLQKMMLMDKAPRVDPSDPLKVIGTVPARCSELQVAAAESVTAEQLLPVVVAAYDRVARRHADMPPSATILTWRQRQSEYIDAVEHEKGLLMVLFGIISIVAVAMITVIFYMIVLEKTRDIGILRTLGASRVGVASIFLLYGGVIGVIGSLLGSALAGLVVVNINGIHAWLGRNLGIVIWDQSVYFFDQIPNRVDLPMAAWVFVIAVVASVFGAVLPALKAARVDPVRSLRYE